MPRNILLYGGITDTDDHVWTGDVKGGGGWRDLDHQNSQLKGVHHDTSKHAHEQVSGTRKAQDVERMAKRVKYGNGSSILIIKSPILKLLEGYLTRSCNPSLEKTWRLGEQNLHMLLK